MSRDVARARYLGNTGAGRGRTQTVSSRGGSSSPRDTDSGVYFSQRSGSLSSNNTDSAISSASSASVDSPISSPNSGWLEPVRSPGPVSGPLPLELIAAMQDFVYHPTPEVRELAQRPDTMFDESNNPLQAEKKDRERIRRLALARQLDSLVSAIPGLDQAISTRKSILIGTRDYIEQLQQREKTMRVQLALAMRRIRAAEELARANGVPVPAAISESISAYFADQDEGIVELGPNTLIRAGSSMSSRISGGVASSARMSPSTSSISTDIARPLGAFGDELPHDDLMKSLLSAYKEELGRVLICDALANPIGDSSPVTRLAMSCLAARYIPDGMKTGQILFRRAWKLLKPTLNGNVSPTLDVCQALLPTMLYLTLSEDPNEVALGEQLFLKLVDIIKQLNLDNEPASVFRPIDPRTPVSCITRDWNGHLIPQRNLEAQRALLWTVFCVEQQVDLQGGVTGSLRNRAISAGLPGMQDKGPLQLETFEYGLGQWASSQLARLVFFHYIIRRGMDCSRAAHSHAREFGGHTGFPVEISNRMVWVRQMFTEYLGAEMEYVHQDGEEIGGVFVMSTRKKRLPAWNNFDNGLKNSIRLATKQVLCRGLTAIMICPREDIEVMFCTINVHPIEKRQAARERLQVWFALPHFQGLAQTAPLAASILNLEDCYRQVGTVVETLEQLAGASESPVCYIHPVFPWCVWMCALLDLTRFLFGVHPEDNESATRLGVYTSFFDDDSFKNAWPIMQAFYYGFQIQYHGAMAGKKLMLKMAENNPYGDAFGNPPPEVDAVAFFEALDSAK